MRDPAIIAVGLLHDTIEDTQTEIVQLRGRFGDGIADKICNLRDILARPPAEWSMERKQEYFDFARQVVDRARGANPKLAAVRSALCAAAGSATLKSGCSRHLFDQPIAPPNAILSA